MDGMPNPTTHPRTLAGMRLASIWQVSASCSQATLPPQSCGGKAAMVRSSSRRIGRRAMDNSSVRNNCTGKTAGVVQRKVGGGLQLQNGPDRLCVIRQRCRAAWLFCRGTLSIVSAQKQKGKQADERRAEQRLGSTRSRATSTLSSAWDEDVRWYDELRINNKRGKCFFFFSFLLFSFSFFLFPSSFFPDRCCRGTKHKAGRLGASGGFSSRFLPSYDHE